MTMRILITTTAYMLILMTMIMRDPSSSPPSIIIILIIMIIIMIFISRDHDHLDEDLDHRLIRVLRQSVIATELRIERMETLAARLMMMMIMM